MASIYLRGDRWWCRLKDETGTWISRPTEFTTSEKHKAQRYATAAQRRIDDRKAAGDGTTAPHTVRSFSRLWLKERRERGVRSVDKEESRIRHHLLPRIGSKRLDEIRPRDIRDLVRALRAGGELAPRTIHNVYGDAHAMFRDAMVEELSTRVRACCRVASCRRKWTRIRNGARRRRTAWRRWSG